MENSQGDFGKVYLDALVNEYNSQESKKGSIESRAGVIVGFYSAFVATSIKDVPIFTKICYWCPCYSLLKILLALSYYILIFLSFYNFYQVLSTKNYYTVEIAKIDNIKTINSENINKLAQSYFQIIKERININNAKSRYFKKLLLSIFISILFYVLYMSIFF